MRSTILFVSVLAACSGGKKSGQAPPKSAVATPVAAEAAGPDRPAAGEPVPPDGEDILAELIEMNGDKYGPPARIVRKGHVTPKKAPAVKRTGTGFEVQFASRASVVTPTVYRGKVMVSGGFQSKEFHAFHATTGKPAWSVNLDDDGPSASACEDGICVFNTESCTVFALDAESGKMRWSWWLSDPQTSAPAIAGGIVFTSYPAAQAEGEKPPPPNASHAIGAIDLKSGKILWQKWLDSDVMSSPVASAEFVYLATFSGAVMKLEQKTGKIRYAIRARATSAPVVQFARDGRESMFYTRRSDVEPAAAPAGAADPDGAAPPRPAEAIIRADDNSPKTTFQAGEKQADYLDEKVQRKARYHQQSEAADAANGFSGEAPEAAQAGAASATIGHGRVASMQAFQGSRILRLEDRVVNTMGDEVVATSATTGKQLWSRKLAGDLTREGGALGTAPLAAGRSILVGTLKGAVLELDPASGKERARFPVGGPIRSQPVVAGGWIYVGTEDGRLIAVNTGRPDLTGWPTWGGNAARTGLAAR